MDNLLNKLFPPKCLFCNEVGELFCKACLRKCRLYKKQKCIVCEKESLFGVTHLQCQQMNRANAAASNLDNKDSELQLTIPTQLISMFDYEGVVRNCIRKAKYSSKQFMALKTLTVVGVKLFARMQERRASATETTVNTITTISAEVSTSKCDAQPTQLQNPSFFEGFTVIPIPMNKDKYKERGFNQAEIIAKSVSREFKLSYNDTYLVRVRSTKAQYEYDRKRRFANVKGAFAVAKPATSDSSVSGKKILLVDDICTTGATFLEAAKTLYQAGAAEVRCFSLSRKVLD
jgi:ComF family protein